MNIQTEATVSRPKLGDNLSDDLKLAIEQMKLEAAAMPQKIVYKKMKKVRAEMKVLLTRIH